MATLGTMRTRIADELQIDATTYATEIDRAIFSATAFYDHKDFWFLDATPATFLLTATSQYSLNTVLPDRTQIHSITLHLSPGRPELYYRTYDEMQELDYDESYTGEPVYWGIYDNQLLIQPKPQRTYTAEASYSLRRSMTASASASSVWTNEAEEMIRLHAEIDLLENRIKDYTEAARKRGRLSSILLDMDEKTVVMRGVRRVQPHM